MTNLNEKAIKMLILNQEKSGNILNINSYEDLFNTVSSFIQNDMLEEAKKTLDYICKFQTRKGNFQFKKLLGIRTFDDGRINPIYFLKILTQYLQKENNKKEIMRYSKEIKRAVNYLEERFDNIYILFFDYDKGGLKRFSMKENVYFLSFAEELSDILNQYNLNKEADKIFVFKTKIALGFLRYFYVREQRVLVTSFKPEVKLYKIANYKRALNAVLNYKFNDEFEKILLSEIKSRLTNEKDVETILKILIFLKMKKDKSFKKFYEKYKHYFYFFPIEILNEKDYNPSIEKSLFIDFNSEIKKFEKEKMILKNLNSLKIANLVLKLEED